MNLYFEFELSLNTTETTKNICVKSEGTVDPRTVTSLFKKFCLGCKNLDNQVGLKIVDS